MNKIGNYGMKYFINCFYPNRPKEGRGTNFAFRIPPPTSKNKLIIIVKYPISLFTSTVNIFEI